LNVLNALLLDYKLQTFMNHVANICYLTVLCNT